jgi:hypothetical protein
MTGGRWRTNTARLRALNIVIATLAVTLALLVPCSRTHSEEESAKSPFTDGVNILHSVLKASLELHEVIVDIQDTNVRIITIRKLNRLSAALHNLENTKRDFNSTLILLSKGDQSGQVDKQLRDAFDRQSETLNGRITELAGARGFFGGRWADARRRGVRGLMAHPVPFPRYPPRFRFGFSRAEQVASS